MKISVSLRMQESSTDAAENTEQSVFQPRHTQMDCMIAQA